MNFYPPTHNPAEFNSRAKELTLDFTAATRLRASNFSSIPLPDEIIHFLPNKINVDLVSKRLNLGNEE